MVKKLKSQGDKQLVENVMEMTRLIWLAGLGAFAKVEEEGGRLFETLVREGERLQHHTKKIADDAVEDVKDKVGEIKEKAVDAFDKLEEALEDRVARILNQLGVPTSKDIEDLSKRVDALNESVRKLTKS